MKLIELLARELKEWPEGAVIVVQDGDKMKTVKFAGKGYSIEMEGFGLENVWQGDWAFHFRGDFDHHTLAEDYRTAIVTRDEWEAAR